MKITRLGHAMYLFTSQNEKRYLVDPFFDMNPGCPADYQTETFLKSIDAVFLTHGHFDHTSGLQKLKDVHPTCLVVAQYELAMILMQKGFQNVYPLNLGGSIQLEDVNAVMVPALHTSSYGETEGTPIYAGVPAGYVLEFAGDRNVYHSGDTALMMDMKLIQEVYQPSVAILSSSGQFIMGPREAAYAVKNLLKVEYVIPSHSFPSKETACSPETLEALLGAFPVVENMIGRDVELQQLLENGTSTKVVVLGYGEEVSF